MVIKYCIARNIALLRKTFVRTNNSVAFMCLEALGAIFLRCYSKGQPNEKRLVLKEGQAKKLQKNA